MSNSLDVNVEEVGVGPEGVDKSISRLRAHTCQLYHNPAINQHHNELIDYIIV